MHDKNVLCDKIKGIYPEIGECGIDVDINYDESKQSWVVDLHKQGHERLKTYLTSPDADACMEGKQCVTLGAPISQLVANIKALDKER